MTYLNFSEINSTASSMMKYLNPFNLSNSTVLSDKYIAVIAAFAVSAHNFGGNAVLNDSFKYTVEQKFFSQEERLVKTIDAENILKNNIELSILVFRAKFKLMDYFGLASLYLEVVEENKLLLSVYTKMSPSESLEKLQQFDDEWWIENEPLADGRLCIDVVSV